MRVTNKYNLPETIMNVIERPAYTKGGAHISATELLNSPRIVQLKRKYWEFIETDASEMVWALFGSAVHNLLEHGKGENHIVEQRLHTEIDGWHLSGAIDLQEIEEDGVNIKDYKVTGAWSVMNEKQDWHNQLNVYAYLVEAVAKKPVKSLGIVAIVRDWAARDTAKEGYPQAPIVVIDIPLWPMEKREAFIKERIGQHAEAYFHQESDGELPLCSESDMWEKPTSYAIMKLGAMRAKSVHKTLEDAQHALNQVKGYELETRQGERTRCAKYCQVSSFCTQYQQYQNEQQEQP
jgi:hypothetical protein